MFTAVGVFTALVVTLKVAPVPPAATVTLEGTCAAGLFTDSVTTAPDAGAVAFKVTVAVDELPPVRVAGLNTSEDTARVVTFGVVVLVIFE